MPKPSLKRAVMQFNPLLKEIKGMNLFSKSISPEVNAIEQQKFKLTLKPQSNTFN